MINSIPANNINFTAKCVKDDVKILKKDENNKYSTYNAKLVEFDLNKEQSKIKSICAKDEFYKYGNDLYEDIYEEKFFCDAKKHCYALIENTEENMEDINEDKVLGIFDLLETDDKKVPITLPHFVTNIEYINEYGSGKGEFKEIGRGMFKSVTKIYPDTPVGVFADWDAIHFWEKVGFRHLSERRLVYVPESQKDTIGLDLYG